jgi:protein phosphatase
MAKPDLASGAQFAMDRFVNPPGPSAAPPYASASDPRTSAVNVRLDAAGLTDVGRERDRNEDAYLIATLQRSMIIHDASQDARGWFSGEPAGTLLIVADGMGGQGGGDVASRVAINAVASYLLNVMPWMSAPAEPGAMRQSLPGLREQLSSALVASDRTVKEAGLKAGVPQMGTTLTMALVLWPILYVAHVGDSRCYQLRSGTLNRLTKDHNLAEQLHAATGEVLSARSELQNVLWNSLGAGDRLPQPEISKITLEPGDVLLLCSDGLTKHVEDAELASILVSGQSSKVTCAALIDRANAAGGSDNVTAVVLKTAT